jgi:hypothetical protein
MTNVIFTVYPLYFTIAISGLSYVYRWTSLMVSVDFPPGIYGVCKAYLWALVDFYDKCHIYGVATVLYYRYQCTFVWLSVYFRSGIGGSFLLVSVDFPPGIFKKFACNSLYYKELRTVF